MPLPLTSSTALVLSLGMAVSACESTRSFERAADGSTVYLDQLSQSQKSEAAGEIAQTLDLGLKAYDIGIGDEFEVFFQIDRKPTDREYRISVADKLRVDFLNETNNNRVVEVRPDGRISLPLLGPVMAAGKTIDGLARELEHRYAGLMTRPQITVNATETHSSLADFIDEVGAGKGRSIVDKVLPDGTISLPRLQPLPARGRTIEELEKAIDAAYATAGLDVSVSFVPRSLRAGTTLVFGEVARPGRIDTDRPQTVLMTIAQAGGVLPTGSLEAVRVFYVGSDRTPHLRSVNLSDVMDGLKLDEDMIVPRNAVVYVPPTALAKTGRMLDAVLRDVLRFQGFSIGGTYLFNNPSAGSTIVVPSR